MIIHCSYQYVHINIAINTKAHYILHQVLENQPHENTYITLLTMHTVYKTVLSFATVHTHLSSLYMAMLQGS